MRKVRRATSSLYSYYDDTKCAALRKKYHIFHRYLSAAIQFSIENTLNEPQNTKPFAENKRLVQKAKFPQ